MNRRQPSSNKKMTIDQRKTAIRGRLEEDFAARYQTRPRIFRAPGRVNLIGEHTDYNDGFALPAAINLYTWIAIAPRFDGILRVFSENLNEAAEIDLRESSPRPLHHWTDYVRGVSLMLRRIGRKVDGADMLIYSELPSGAGLSSSAALEVSSASSLLAVSGQSLTLLDLAKLCQRAENEFVGARCGIMDQFAACLGGSGRAMLLDCRSLEYKNVPLPSDVAMVICNTMVKHGHSGGEYNARRAQCEEAVRILKRHFPAIRALRDVTLSNLEAHRGELSDVVYKRSRHIITENARVLDLVSALESGDLKAVGRLMAESHASLRDDYEVSCRELDLMVELAAGREGVLGSRMTGGGFGGCTITLAQTEHVERFRFEVGGEYERHIQIKPEIYVSTAGSAVAEIGSNGDEP